MEVWSIAGKPRLKFPIIRRELPSSQNTTLVMSDDGRFVAAKEGLLHQSSAGELVLSDFRVDAESETGMVFDHDSRHFAHIQREGSKTVILIYKILMNRDFKLLASHNIEADEGLMPYEVKIVFNRTRALVFGYTFWTELALNRTCIATVKDTSAVAAVNISEGTVHNRCGRHC